MISWVASATSQNRPAGEAPRRISRTSCSNSARREPKRCGADPDIEKTDATISASERSTTRSPATTRRRGPAKPAASMISPSPLGDVWRVPWPPRLGSRLLHHVRVRVETDHLLVQRREQERDLAGAGADVEQPPAPVEVELLLEGAREL